MGLNIVFRKGWFRWVRMHIENFVASGPKFTTLFSQNTGRSIVKNISFLCRYPFCRYGELNFEFSKIAPNFACFWPSGFFGKGLSNFQTWILREIWANAHETCDSISLISYPIALVISSNFSKSSLFKCASQPEIVKNLLKLPIFWFQCRSESVIHVRITEKLVNSACYDEQQACVYLQPFLC